MKRVRLDKSDYEAAKIMCIISRQKLDRSTAKEINEVHNKLVMPFLYERLMPQNFEIYQHKNRDSEIHQDENKNIKENDVNFSPNTQFVKKLETREIRLDKLPPLGKAIDKTTLPELPPIKILQGLIGNCSRPFEKQLTITDLKGSQGRLALCKEAVEMILKPLMNEEENNKKSFEDGIPVTIYNQAGKSFPMFFKLWADKMYVLTSGWNSFYEANKLKAVTDWITVWMFRLNQDVQQLCFAIIARRFPIDHLVGKTQKNGNNL